MITVKQLREALAKYPDDTVCYTARDSLYVCDQPLETLIELDGDEIKVSRCADPRAPYKPDDDMPF